MVGVEQCVKEDGDADVSGGLVGEGEGDAEEEQGQEGGEVGMEGGEGGGGYEERDPPGKAGLEEAVDPASKDQLLGDGGKEDGDEEEAEKEQGGLVFGDEGDEFLGLAVDGEADLFEADENALPETVDEEDQRHEEEKGDKDAEEGPAWVGWRSTEREAEQLGAVGPHEGDVEEQRNLKGETGGEDGGVARARLEVPGHGKGKDGGQGHEDDDLDAIDEAIETEEPEPEIDPACRPAGDVPTAEVLKAKPQGGEPEKDAGADDKAEKGGGREGNLHQFLRRGGLHGRKGSGGGVGHDGPVGKNSLSSADRADDLTAERAAVPGAIIGFAEGACGIDNPGLVGIEEGDIGGGSGLEGAGRKFAELGGPVGEKGEKFGQAEFAGMDEHFEADGEAGLEADNPVGGVVELHVLFIIGVRSVVGGDAADGAVEDPPDKGLAIRLGAQGGIHFKMGIVAEEGLIGKGKMVGGDLGGNAVAATSRVADDVHGMSAGDMLKVDVSAGIVREDGIPHDDDILGSGGPALQAETEGDIPLVHDGAFGEAGILAMVKDGEVKHVGVFENAAHEFVALDTTAVIGDGDDAGALEGAKGCHFPACHALGQATGRVNVNDGIALGGVLDELDRSGVVADRRGIGHADDGGKASGGGAAAAAADGFLMGLSGIAEVDMDIDKAGADNEAGRVDHLYILHAVVGPFIDDFSINGVEIADFVATGGWVDHAPVLYMQDRAH